MQITPISLYKFVSFGREKDEYQPISDSMRTIFREDTEPKSRQRLLWELSEVPDFYEASKNESKQDLLELADLMERQRTNILQMALDGDIQVIRKSKDGSPKAHKLLSLISFIKQNQRLPEGQRRRLVDFLRSDFLSQIEEDALAQKFDTKEYPKNMRYIKDKNGDGQIRYARLNDGAAQFKTFMELLSSGSPLSDNDIAISFEQDIEERTDCKVKGFSYPQIAPQLVEEEYPVSYPELYRVLEESREVPPEIRHNVGELRKIPYFKNLTKKTFPPNLFIFSKLNLVTGNLLEKMLKKEVTLDVRNPVNGKYVKTPIIDIGKLLYEIKEGKIQEGQIDEIIKKHTLAFELCSLFATACDKLQGKKLKSIEMERFGNNFGFVAIAVSGEKVPECLSPEGNEAVQKILAALDKLPFKRAVLNFETKK